MMRIVLGLALLLTSGSIQAEIIAWEGLGAGGSDTSLDVAGSSGSAWGGALPGASDAAEFHVTVPGTYSYSTASWAGSDSFTMWGDANTIFSIQCQGTSNLAFGQMTVTNGSFNLGARKLAVSRDLANSGTLTQSQSSRINVAGEFWNMGDFQMVTNSSSEGHDIELTAGSIINSGHVSTPSDTVNSAYLKMTATGAFQNSGTIEGYRMTLTGDSFTNASGGIIKPTDPRGGYSTGSACTIVANSFLNKGTIDTAKLTVTVNGAEAGVNEGLIQVKGGTQWNAVVFNNMRNAPTGTIRMVDVANAWQSEINFGTFLNEGNVEIPALTNFLQIRGTITNNGAFTIDPATDVSAYYLTLLPGAKGYSFPFTMKVGGTLDNQLTDPSQLDLTSTAVRGGYKSVLEAASTGDSDVNNFAIGKLVGNETLSLTDTRNNTSTAGSERLVVKAVDMGNGVIVLNNVPMTVTGSFSNNQLYGGNTELKLLGDKPKIGVLRALANKHFTVKGLDSNPTVLPVGAALVVEEGATMDLPGCDFTDIAGSISLYNGSSLPAVANISDIHGAAGFYWNNFSTVGGLHVYQNGLLTSEGPVTVNGDLVLDNDAKLHGGPFTIAGRFSAATTNPEHWWYVGSLPDFRPELRMTGGVGIDWHNPDQWIGLEVAGLDDGATAWQPPGWVNAPIDADPGFFLDTLVIGPGAHIKLEDLIDNQHRGGPAGQAEALYVYNLQFEDAQGQLWLNDLHLYYNNLVGGTSQIVAGEVPEPATLSLLMIGVLAVIRRRNR